MIGPETEKIRVHHVQAGLLDLTLFTHSFLGLGQDAAQQLSLQQAHSRMVDPEKTDEVSIPRLSSVHSF